MIEVSQKTLEKLKKEKIIPRSKWYFQLNHASIWAIWGLSVILGSVACGIVIFQMVFADWDIADQLTDGFGKFLIIIIPYFWLVFLALFSFLAYYYFRQTKTGYRHHALFIILTSIILSLLGGGVLYASGLAEKMEQIFINKIPFYEQIHRPRLRMWFKPEHGFLTGRVTDVINGQIKMEDPGKREWIIKQLEDFDFPRVPKPGDRLNMRGQLQDGIFIPEEIRLFLNRQQILKKMKENIPPPRSNQ